ncbi:MAG: hypothetical protein L3K18_03005 [Thermoplasmata archaeon]|nr:hypothetical protein [Thermoplasmata archaeon]MCI4356100.1 hypothetical protein [Thermoplasmata archaeon]
MATNRAPPRSRSRPPKKTASEVAPGVFVGGWKDATDFPGTRFCVLDEAPDEPIPAETHLPIYDPVADRPIRANLDRLATLAETARGREEAVLFFCGHGVRRGPLAAAWFLHRHEGVSLEVAYDRIRAVRPQVETAKEWAGDVSGLADDRPPVRR